MNYYSCPILAKVYLDRLRQMVDGERVMHSIQYSERGPEYHLSEFQMCPLPSYYRRVMPIVPPVDDASILRFFRGRIIERAIAKETESICVDEIWATADDLHPEYGLVEIKSTAKGSEFFDPVHENPEWLERMKGYCHVHKKTEIGLIVFFLIGNSSDFLPWAIKKNGKKPEKYLGVDFKGWRFEFTAEEIEDNWKEMIRRKELLKQALIDGNWDNEEIERRRPSWQCKVCQYKVDCPHDSELMPLAAGQRA